jgi:hypothetical protein
MGLVDKTEVFCENLALLEGGVTDVIDLGATPTLRAASLSGLHLIIEVTQQPTDELEEITEVTSPTVHWKSEATICSELIVGYRIASLPLPTKANYERYLGVRIAVAEGGEPVSTVTGKYTAYLSTDPMLKTNYPNGV